MSNEENKRIIAERLERRKAERVAAEREAKLERYEQDQIHACNENFAGAKLKRDAEAATQRTIQEAAARSAARAEAQAKKQAREDAAMAACRYYGLPLSNVDVFNASLTITTAPDLTYARYCHGASSVGDHVIFGGGDMAYNKKNNSEAYSASMTHVVLDTFDDFKWCPTSTKTGSHALFTGGGSTEGYDTSLTRLYVYNERDDTPNEWGWNFPSGVSGNGRVLIAGGNRANNVYEDLVVEYNKNLTREIMTPLSVPRKSMAAAVAGVFALFAGGYGYDGVTATVEAYAID